MSIIRVRHNTDFVVMNKTGLEDPDLSFKAKGLLAYLLSKPDNWTAKISHLKKVSTNGRDSVRTGLKELKKRGYLERNPIRDEKGKIKEWESIIREIPVSSPETDNPTLDNPTLDNPTLINNDSNNNELNNKTEEEDARKISEKISKRFEQIFNRKISVELYNKLIKIYSDPQILMKALQIAEEQADKPKYLLVILKDWKNQNMTSVNEINQYLRV